jgi:hypothetical protein
MYKAVMSVGVCMAISAIFTTFILFGWPGYMTREAKPLSTVMLYGKWRSTSYGEDQVTAMISAEGIEIYMRDVLYWSGSFELPPMYKPTDEIRLTSVASDKDLEIMKMSIFGSQDATKSFKIYSGQVWFTRTMIGSSRDICLDQIKG